MGESSIIEKPVKIRLKIALFDLYARKMTIMLIMSSGYYRDRDYGKYFFLMIDGSNYKSEGRI